MKRCWNRVKTPTLLLALTLLVGCSTAPPEPTITSATKHPLEQNALDALAFNLTEQAEFSLLAALQHYESIDDLPGQWRTRHTLTSLALSREDHAGASKHVKVLALIAPQLKQDHISYKTSLMLGRIHTDESYFRQAISFASSDMERAVAESYLGNTAKAAQMITDAGSDAPNDKAFVLYRHAKASGSKSHYKLALDAYKIAGDSRGVADSLVSLAKLEADQGAKGSARTYARRAIRVLNSINDKARAKKVSDWLDSL